MATPAAHATMQFSGTANILHARENLEHDNGMESMAAFHRWRMSSMKTQYGRQLRGILADVRRDEERLKHAQGAVSEYRSREASLNNEVSKLRVENSRASAELERFLGEYHRLEQAMQNAMDAREVAEARAEAAEASVRILEATKSSGTSVDQTKWESLIADLETMKASQGKLMDTLAARDEAVASMGSEAQAAKHKWKQAEIDLERMEGIVRSTGEKAAVAEARAADLEVEIAALREATRKDYAEKRRLSAASAEIEDYKQQLAETSRVNASLAAARDELKTALNTTSQRLAASDGRNKYLSKSADYLQMLERVFEGTGYAQQDGHLRKLGAEVNRMTSETAQMAGQIDQLECIVSQKEEQIDELHGKNETLKARNLVLEDAVTKNRRLQLALEESKDFLAEEKSLRVAAEHRAASLASQNSLKDYILKVRAKTANEDVATALEKLNAELNQRTDDAAALAGRASLAESRLDDVTALQSALAAKISDLETLRAQGGTSVVHTASRSSETSTMPGSIQGPGPALLVPQEALQVAERRRAVAEAQVSQLQRQLEHRQESIRAFVDRVAGLHELVDLTAVFSQWRGIVSQAKMAKYLNHFSAQSQVRLALVDMAGRHSERSFLVQVAVMFAGWRVRTARVYAMANKWRSLAGRAVDVLWGPSDLHISRTVSLVRLRRLRGGGCFIREVSEVQTLRLALRGWRSHVTECKLDDLTAALPPWIERIGEKRCMEKHWMAWRIATYASLARQPRRPSPQSAVPSAIPRLHPQRSNQAQSSQQASHALVAASVGPTPVQTGGQVAEPQYQFMPPSPVTPYVPPNQIQGHQQAAGHLAEYRRSLGTVIPEGFSSSTRPAAARSPGVPPDTGNAVESSAPRARAQDTAPRPHTSMSVGPSPRMTGRSISAPPQRTEESSLTAAGPVSPLQKPLRKGTGRGGMPNRARDETDPKPLYAFGHHIPPEDETAASIANQPLTSPLRQHRTSPGHDIEPRVYISSPRVPRQADNTPVVQAFGTTVSHDPQALIFATGQQSMRDLVPPDALPVLPGSAAGPATKAKAVERVVDALAHTLNEVASSLAHGTARAEYAVDRLHMSPTKAQLRTSLVQHGMTGPLAVGSSIPAQSESSLVSPPRRSPPVRPISNMPSVTSRVGKEAMSPKKIRPSPIPHHTSDGKSWEMSGAEGHHAMRDGKSFQHEPREKSIGPGSNAFERQCITREHSVRGTRLISSQVAIPGDGSPPALSSFQAVREGSPVSSPRNIAGISGEDSHAQNLRVRLPGTGPLSPREKRDFENLLTSGASGYSPRELRELRQRGEELLNQPLQPLSALQAYGSHLVVSQSSRILNSTAASEARSGHSSASASPTDKLRDRSPGSRCNIQPGERSRAGSPRPPSTASPQKPPAEPSKPSKSASPSYENIQSRLFNPTAASLNRASAVKRSRARREADKENELSQRP